MRAQRIAFGDLPLPPAGRTGWPWTEEPDSKSQPVQEFEALPAVSVVIPSFNHGPQIERTIRSIVLQSYPNIECIVIDGGSTDETVQILRKYEQWLDYWVSEPDRGHGDAINKGIAHAKGDALVIMPSDDIFYPDALSKLVQLRAQDPRAVCWVGACRHLDPNGAEVFLGKPYVNDIESMGDWGQSAWLGIPSALFDMPAFRRVGGIDERFHVASDVELWVRLAKVGTIATTDDVVGEARYVSSSVSNRDQLETQAALITLNYLHGHVATAKGILARYRATLVNEMRFRDLLGVLVSRFMVGMKWRVLHLFGVRRK